MGEQAEPIFEAVATAIRYGIEGNFLDRQAFITIGGRIKQAVSFVMKADDTPEKNETRRRNVFGPPPPLARADDKSEYKPSFSAKADKIMHPVSNARVGMFTA